MNRQPPAVVLLGGFGRDLVTDALGPAATSPVIAVGCLSFLSMGSIVRLSMSTVAEFLMAGLALLVAFGLFMLLAAFARRARSRTTSVVALVAAFSLSEVARFLISDVPQYELLQFSSLAYGVIAAGLTGIAFFGVVSALVNAAKRYREHRALLFEARAELDREYEHARVESSRDRQSLVDSTKVVLDIALRDALASSAQSGDVGGAVLRLVDSTIRPLGRRLDDVAGLTLASAVPSEPPRVRTLGVLRHAVNGDAFDPRPVLTVIVLLGFGFALILGEARGPVIGISWFGGLLVAAGGVLLVAQRLLSPLLSRWPLPAGVTLVVSVYLVMAGATALVDASAREHASVPGFLYVAVIGALMPAVLSAIRGLERARAQVLDDLAAMNERIRRTAGRELAVAWSEHRELGRAVHRDVQAAAIAAAWRYRLDIEHGKDSNEALRALRSTIYEAVESLTIDHEVAVFATIVRRSCQTWVGICALRVVIADRLARELDSEHDTRRIIAELLTEFVTNAVKHGRAKRAVADITQVDTGVLKMRFWNDGLPVDLSAAHGFGLNDVVRRSIGFRAQNVSDGVEFFVRIPR